MIYKGQKYNHLTLGLVEVYKVTPSSLEGIYVKVLTNYAKGIWTSDEGDSFHNQKGEEWWVNKENLTPTQDTLSNEKDRIKLKMKLLWNNSNWVISGKGTQIA